MTELDSQRTISQGTSSQYACSHCHTHLEGPWKFCPNCGYGNRHEDVRQEFDGQSSPPVASPPLPGLYGGFFLGAIIAPTCLIVGSLLCLTGLGAIVGIPMIVAGLLAPLLGTVYGTGDVHIR
jgi:hypothetical protein